MKLKQTVGLAFLVILTMLLAACRAPADSSYEQTSAPESGNRPEGAGGPPGGPGGFGEAGLMQIISDATGLDIDSIGQQTAGGATLAEIITANGGNEEEVKARLIESMSQMPNADETDIEQRVSDLLNNPMPQPGPGDGSGGAWGGRQGDGSGGDQGTQSQ